jgi:magnesium transporter
MLIMRVPVITDTLVGKSIGFILTKEHSYFYNREKASFEKLEGLFMGPYHLVDKIIDKLLKSFLKYQESILDMEETLYANTAGKNFLNNWLVIKLEVLRIERILLKLTQTMDELLEYYKEQSDFPINNYVDIHEHIDRTTRSATLQLSKLDDLYSFYNAKSNDKMNKMIYILTIISAIFLPLNLMVGFFGMNTSGLPFAEGTNGTSIAISLMFVLGALSMAIVHFWRKKVEK